MTGLRFPSLLTRRAQHNQEETERLHPIKKGCSWVFGPAGPRWGTIVAALLTAILMVGIWDLYPAIDLSFLLALCALELAAIDAITRWILRIRCRSARVVILIVPMTLGCIYVAQLYSTWISGGFIPPIALANREVTGLISFSGVYALFAGFLLTFSVDALFRRRPSPAHRPLARSLISAALFSALYSTLIYSQPLSGGIALTRGEAPISSFIRSALAYSGLRSLDQVSAATLNSIRVEFTRRTVYEQGFPHELLSNMPRRPNVILIFTEGMSARWMETYGGIHPGLTPNLDELAKKSLMFTNYYNHTAATFRGLRGQLTSGHQEADGYNDDGTGIGQRDVSDDVIAVSRASVPELLRRHGYQSAFFLSQQEFLNKMIETLGFDRTLGRDYLYDAHLGSVGPKHPRYLSDSQLFAAMIAELESLPDDRPFFAAAYNFETHAFLDGELKYPGGDNPVLNRFHTYDREVGIFVRNLMASKLHENTVIVFTSDHSTYPGPQAVKADGRKPRHFVDTIPLMIYWKGAEHRIIDAGGSNSLALAPSLLSLLGVREAPNRFLGCTLFEHCLLNRISNIGSEYIFTDRTSSYRESQLPDKYQDQFLQGKQMIERYKLIDLVVHSKDDAHIPTQRGATVAESPESEELPVGDLIPQPLLIESGREAQVPLRSGFTGAVSAIGVQIGNFAGASDGDLNLTVCSEANCVSGAVPLTGTVDNAYVDVPLDQHLQVDAGASLMLSIGKDEGSHDVAVWLYEASDPMTRPDGALVSATPRLKLIFEN